MERQNFGGKKNPGAMFNSDIFFMKIIALEKIAKPLPRQFHAPTVSDPRKTNIYFFLYG